MGSICLLDRQCFNPAGGPQELQFEQSMGVVVFIREHDGIHVKLKKGR